MLQYVKAKFYNRENGQFKLNALLVKLDGTTDSNLSSFYIVAPAQDINSASHGSPYIEFDNHVRFTSVRPLYGMHLFTGTPVDSFETCLISERLRPASFFSRYNAVLHDEVVTVGRQGTPAVINYDELFEAATSQVSSTDNLLMLPNYTANSIYTGQLNYHNYQRNGARFNTPLDNDKPYRIGIELELYAKDAESYNKIIRARTNWFQCERDSSLREREYPIEMKTIPLRPCDATSLEFWHRPMSRLHQLAVSGSYSTTGLHVHISKEIFGRTESERTTNIQKLIWFYTYFVEDDPQAHAKNAKICGREHGYSVSDDGAKTEVSEIIKLLGLNTIGQNDEAFGKVAEGMYSKCMDHRDDVNIKHLNDYGTVEFRKGKGYISRYRLAGLCTWWEQMCLYCNETHPRNMSFDAFFERVMQFPAVSFFFREREREDEEA